MKMKHENHNQQKQMTKKQIKKDQEERLKLKAAAERYRCKVPSLRNGIKTDRLPAEQVGPNAVYQIKPADVERFLKGSPGIASIFHPKKDGNAQSTPSEKAFSGSSKSSKPLMREKSETTTSYPNQLENQNGDDTGKTPKRQRSRRRGRGRTGGGAPAVVHRDQILKALDGTTDQERLRIVACLNELTAIVASA